MTIEIANILLGARDDMTGIEIALVAVIRGLQERVEELERVLERKQKVRCASGEGTYYDVCVLRRQTARNKSKEPEQ